MIIVKYFNIILYIIYKKIIKNLIKLYNNIDQDNKYKYILLKIKIIKI